MKKALVILLCALAIFAIVSCKNEPKPEPAAETFEVTFNSQSGSAVAAITVEKGAAVAKPEDPTKADYHFGGWFKEAECTNEYDFSTPVTAALTLYAKWYDTVKLTAEKGINDALYDYDRFEFHFDRKVNQNDVLTITYRSTRPIKSYNIRTLKSTDVPDIRWVYEGKTGMTISDPDDNGWVTASYTFGLTVDRGFNPTDGSSDKTKQAIVAADYDLVTNVEFHLQGKLLKGDFVEIKEITWNGEPVDVEAVAKAAAGNYGNTVLDAKNVETIDSKNSTWTGDKTYTVLFYADPTQSKSSESDGHGGTDYNKSDYLTGIGVIVKDGEKVEKPEDPVREGFYFLGWCKDKTYDGSDPSRMWDFDEYTVEEDRKLYAIWTENAYYKLTATRAAKRFGIKYAGGEGEGAINPVAGDVLTFKYRTNHAVTHLYLHDYAYSTQFAKKTDITPYISAADEDGWITFTFTYPEGANATGIYLQLTNYTEGTHDEKKGPFAIGDYLEIKDLTFKGAELTIDPADEETGRSDHGVWNESIAEGGNTDHTIPSLEMVPYV